MPDSQRDLELSPGRGFESPIRLEPHPLLPLRGWVALIAILVVVGLSLQIRPLLMLMAFLSAAVGVSWAWNRYALHGVTYERMFTETHAFHDERVEVSVRLTNRKALPLSWLLVYDLWPSQVPVVEGGQLLAHDHQQAFLINAFSVRWHERIQRRYTLLCNRRGVYTFGPVRVRTGDLFGLFRQEGGHGQIDRLIVYPKILPVEALGLPPKDLFGEVRTQLKIFEDPARTIGVREHMPGDGFRNIHWKATARSQRLQARVYQPATSHTIIVLLNVSTSEEYWRGADPDRLEQAITVAASIANHAASRRYGIGLVVNGTTPHSDQALKVLPGRSPYQLTRVLEALAAVTGFATRSIEDMLLAESPHLPWGATLVVVTAVVTEQLLSTLVRLRQAGRRLALIALTDPSPVHLSREAVETLAGITTYHLPLVALHDAGTRLAPRGNGGVAQDRGTLVFRPVLGT